MASNKEYTLINSPELQNKKIACLTLDLEQDYGDLLDEPSYEGLEHILELINFFKKMNLPLTCFVQGSLLETHPKQIKQLTELNVEFELHSYSHPAPAKMDTSLEVKRGKEAYQKFFGNDPLGYRSPLGFFNTKTDFEILSLSGFKFDSSVCPSLRLGVFNNLRKPLKPYLVNSHKIVEFPISVFSSIIRIPLALSYVRLLGKPYLCLLKRFNLPSLCVFVFHLHDLFKLDSATKIPLRRVSFIYREIFKRIYQTEQENTLHILDELVSSLNEKSYTFARLVDVYNIITAGEYQR
jgi:peptidoglycan/xylan/chitin deacetylase (PgdA/CDA1 family)